MLLILCSGVQLQTRPPEISSFWGVILTGSFLRSNSHKWLLTFRPNNYQNNTPKGVREDFWEKRGRGNVRLQKTRSFEQIDTRLESAADIEINIEILVTGI